MSDEQLYDSFEDYLEVKFAVNTEYGDYMFLRGLYASYAGNVEQRECWLDRFDLIEPDQMDELGLSASADKLRYDAEITGEFTGHMIDQIMSAGFLKSAYVRDSVGRVEPYIDYETIESESWAATVDDWVNDRLNPFSEAGPAASSARGNASAINFLLEGETDVSYTFEYNP